jgi:hypothetical protein
VLRGVETVFEAFGHKSPTVTSLGGQKETHILGDTFYSQAPLLWGPYMAKCAWFPSLLKLKALTDSPLAVNGKPNGLREAVTEFFRRNGAERELRVQLCTDLKAMPIEDASVRWPEERSPYVPVARIAAPSQVAWSEARSAIVDDWLAFNPLHGLTAHRPIRSIMRAQNGLPTVSASSHSAQRLHNDRTENSCRLN